MDNIDSCILIYSVYDISADTWYLLGAYSTYVEVAEFYQTMCQAPFWKDRLSALYVVGSFDQDSGDIQPASRPYRVMVSGKSVSEITSLPEDHNSEGAGGELSPQNEQTDKTPKRFTVFRKIFGSIRHD